MNRFWIALYVSIVVLVILFGGRIIGLPFFLVIVVGGSMEPTLEPGDVVLAVRGEPSINSIVIWCSSPAYCVIHRVVNISGDLVITKGDANPIPDQPVPKSLMKGYVVARIPRLFIVSAIVSIAVAILLLKPRIVMIMRPARDEAVIFLSMFIAFISMLLAIATTYVPPIPITGFTRPSAELVGVSLERGVVVVNLSLTLISISDITCTIHYLSSSTACTALAEDRGGWASISIPINRSIIDELNKAGSNRFYVALVMWTNTSAVIRGWNYTVLIPYRELEINMTSTGISITNPNPFCTPYEIMVMKADREGESWRVSTASGCLGPGDAISIPRDSRYMAVKLEYILMGGKRVVQKIF